VVHAVPWPTQEDRRGGQAAAAQREAQRHVVQRAVRRCAAQDQAQRCVVQPAERALHAVRVPGEVLPPHEVLALDEGPAPREARKLRGRGARLALLHLLAYAVGPVHSLPLQRTRSKLLQCDCSIGTWHHLLGLQQATFEPARRFRSACARLKKTGGGGRNDQRTTVAPRRISRLNRRVKGGRKPA
jgi:hypothetical protein